MSGKLLLLGHNDVSTTMIYNHVLRQGGQEVKSPLEFCDPNVGLRIRKDI